MLLRTLKRLTAEAARAAAPVARARARGGDEFEAAEFARAHAVPLLRAHRSVVLALLSLLARERSVATLTRRVPGGVEELARALEMYAGDADVEERAKLAVAQVGLAVTSADGGGAMPTLATPGGGGSIGGSVSASVGKTPSYLKRTGAVKTCLLYTSPSPRDS